MKSQPKIPKVKGPRRATVATQTNASAEVTLSVSAAPYQCVETHGKPSPYAKVDKSSPGKCRGAKVVEKVNPPRLKKPKEPARKVEAPTSPVRKAPAGREELKAKVRTDGNSDKRSKKRGKRGGRKLSKTAGPPAAKPFEVYATNMRNALPKAFQALVSVAELSAMLKSNHVGQECAVEAPASDPVRKQVPASPVVEGELNNESTYTVQLSFSSAPQSVEEIRAYHELIVLTREGPTIVDAASLWDLEKCLPTRKLKERKRFEEVCASIAAANKAARDDRALNEAIVEVKLARTTVVTAEPVMGPALIPEAYRTIDTRDGNAYVMKSRSAWLGKYTLKEAMFTLFYPHVKERIEKRTDILDLVSEAMNLALPVSSEDPCKTLALHVADISGYNCLADGPTPEHTAIIPILIAGLVQWLITLHARVPRTESNEERTTRTLTKGLRDAKVRNSDIARMLPWVILAYYTDNSMTKVSDGYKTEPNWGLFKRDLAKEAALVVAKKC